MPTKHDDDLELGAGPTAITSMVDQADLDREDTDRERGPTQQLPIPDPKWAKDQLPGRKSTPPAGETLMDNTYPSAIQPSATLKQRVRTLWRLVSHEFQKLPARTRTIVIVAASVLGGLILGLIVAPSGGSKPTAAAHPLVVVDDELSRHAKRLSMPERDAVVQALKVNDPLAALMLLRAMGAKDHIATDPLGLALRGRLALYARDGVDALDNLEAALTAQPKLADEAWLPAAVVQTFAANKIARTTALLGKLPKSDVVGALGAACMDWQVRVRRGAADALKSMGAQCPDPIGAAIVDAYQADKCDAARTAVAKLLPQAENDVRVAGALDAISRRPSVASCVAELIPRPGAPPPPSDTK